MTAAALTAVMLTSSCGSFNQAGPLWPGPEGYEIILAPVETDVAYITLDTCMERDRGGRIEIIGVGPVEVPGTSAPIEILVTFPTPRRQVSIGAKSGYPPSKYRPAKGAVGIARSCDRKVLSPTFAIVIPRASDTDAVVEGLEIEYAIDGRRYRVESDARLGVAAE